MLERISKIQSVGLLHQANGASHKCQKATLIYADNGRGKSTLATIFRSVSTGDASLINDCKTIDSTSVPEVVLQFEKGDKVKFEHGSWSQKRPEILVFDSDFIGRNVHSGGVVNTDHRKNLLEFALGEAAVAARAEVDKATVDSSAATENQKNIKNQLAGHHQDLSLVEFEKLPHISGIDMEIDKLQKQLTAASNIKRICALPIPNMIMEPQFDIDGLFDALGFSLKDIHMEAEMLINQHITKLGGNGAESWLSLGQQFDNNLACPFCDQDVSNNDLVKAYQAHFNAAYVSLKDKIATLKQIVATSSGASIIDKFARSVEVAVAQAHTFSEHVSTQTISFDRIATDIALTAFRDFVLDLVDKKQAAPAEALGSEAHSGVGNVHIISDKDKATVLWGQVITPLQAVNATIKTAQEVINKYKTQLNSTNVGELQKRMKILQATKRRYDPNVIELFIALASSRASAEAAQDGKEVARANLNNLMKTTLEKYRTTINKILNDFGVSFSIDRMSANYRGDAPRTEYGLLLRGKNVSVDGSAPSFSTSLSDGDKRALAFAFFIATIIEDKNLAKRIIVIDDPMCSLDLNRRAHTLSILNTIHSKSEQLIVLAHDPYFLRDLRDKLQKNDKDMQIAMLQLDACASDYTRFASLNIEEMCASTFVKNYTLCSTFCTEGSASSDLMSVAKAIRPMLEGYLHRSFPLDVPKGKMFGEIVHYIKNAIYPSPLCHAQNLVDELREINDYAGKFHHDTNPDAERARTNTTELKTWVKRALLIVHGFKPYKSM